MLAWLNAWSAAALAPVLVAAALCAGCGKGPLRFPARPLAETPGPEDGFTRAYDTDGDGVADYFTMAGPSGRIDRIGYDRTGDGEPDFITNLDDLLPTDRRHVVFILDGMPFDLVRECYEQGLLRRFYPPVRVVSPFPSMTDLAIADVFHSMRPLGYEALYYDHEAGRLEGGDRNYLGKRNEPWTGFLDYRAGTLLDALGYLYPWWAFDHEVEELLELYEKRARKDLNAYFVSTAGIGSREGREGMRRVLEEVDRLVEQLTFENDGLVRFTLLADHGHTMAHCVRPDLRAFLKERGWRIVKQLERPRDVAPIEYGLITYASFATRDRRALAEVLLEHEAVVFTVYPEDAAVVVLAPGAEARVECRGGRYRYAASQGDPLGLDPAVGRLRDGGLLDADGFASEDDWFRATAGGAYPDAPSRLWRAFHGVAEHVPDVVADLKAGYCAGSAGKKAWIKYMASTHGDLGADSSTAFLMSTMGPIPVISDEPPATRSRELPAILSRLLGRPWPTPHPARED